MSSTTATHSAAESAENRGPIILGVNVTITLIAALVVVLRTISRSVVVRHMGLDDWFMIAATFAAVSNIVVVCFSVNYGAGRHLWTIKKTQVLPSGILRYTTHIMYPIISGLIKISILFLYLRIFSPIRKAILATFFLVIAMTLAVALATAFECNPIAASWNPSGIKNYTCFNSIVFNYTASALYSVTDVWILILPVPTVLSLQISQRQKKVLLGIFSLGFISCIAGIVRMAYLVKFWDSEDPTWDTFAVSVTSGCELALGIIAASVPALKPLIDRYAPAVFKSSRNQSQATRQRGYGTGNETSKGYGIRSNVGSIPLQSFSARDKDVLYRSEGDAESTKGIKRAYVDEMKAESTGS